MERERGVMERERGITEREKKADKAKQEYSLLFNELKWRKKAVDDQQRRLSSVALMAASSNNTTAAADDSSRPAALDGGAPNERWAKRGEREVVSRPSQAVVMPRPATAGGEHPQSRSPTPHPRQGYLIEGAADKPVPLVRPSTSAAAPKARYGVEIAANAKRVDSKGIKARGDESESDEEPCHPFNVHARRMFAAPVTEELDSSIDSPPAPRRLVSAPPMAVA